MSRPLSDDERRAINVKKLDAALDDFVNTPIDELDSDQFLADLDSALTPGNMRRSLDVPDDPIARGPKRALHHDVGDADIGDDDVQMLPTWDDEIPAAPETEYSGQSTLSDVEAEPEPTPREDWTAPEKISGADDSVGGDDAAAESRVEAYTPLYQPPRDRTRQSVDPSLQLSPALRGILDRRLGSATPHNDVYGGAHSGSDHAYPTDADHTPLEPEPVAAAPTPATPEPDFRAPAHDDTVVIAALDSQPTPSTPNDPPPIPLRSNRADKLATTNSDSEISTLGALKSAVGSLPPRKRMIVKWVIPAMIIAALLWLLNSCLSESDTPTPTAAPVATSEDAAPSAQSTASAEIPVPESAVGVLAPSGVSARCPEGSTDARFAFTPDKSQAWICKRALGIDGAVMEITFPYPVVITDVFLVPGFDYVEPSGIDRWVEHRAVTRAQWTIGSQRFIQEINPSRTGANMTIPAVTTQKITLTIMETAETSNGGGGRGFGAVTGTKDDSFAISLIRITGHQP